MSDDEPPNKGGPEARRPLGAGRSGPAASIGAELGALDFEPDALLDSLLTEDDALPASPRVAVRAPSSPGSQSGGSAPPPTPDLAPRPPAAPRPAPTPAAAPAAPRPAVTAAAPPAPRRASPTPPAPASSAGGLPRPAPRTPLDRTQKPPAVNPAGPPPREPFLPAHSPVAPVAADVGAGELDFELMDAGSFEPPPVAAAGEAPAEPPADPVEFEASGELSAAEAAELEALAAASEDAGAEDVEVPSEDAGPAAAQLASMGTLDAFAERARWTEERARELVDTPARARGLLIASELWALTGELTHARELAGEAASLVPSGYGARQQRALAAVEGDLPSVVKALDVEARAAATPELRTHAATLAADIARLLLEDAAGAERRLAVAAKLSPSDARAPLLQVAAALGQARPARPKLPEGAPLAGLRHAVDALLVLRGLAAGDAPPSPLWAFERARRALGAHDRATAAAALLDLGGLAPLGVTSRWLASAVAAPTAASRGLSTRALEELLQIEPNETARRALAARALESGDATAVLAALESDVSSSPTFGPADALALAVLAGADGGKLRDRAAAALGVVELEPLAAAVDSCAAGALDAPAVLAGIESSRARVALGRALAGATREGGAARVAAAVDAAAAALPGDPAATLLALELARRAGDYGALATSFTSGSGAGVGGDERSRRLAAALASELAQDSEGAVEQYRGALEADPRCEAATRVLASVAGGEGAADLLASLAAAWGEGPPASLLLVEAALGAGFGAPDRMSELLLEAGTTPEVPFAARWGELLGRMRGDTDAVLGWQRARRAAADDPVERAHDLVREALLVAEADLDQAASLIGEAVQARPEDVALRELHERLAPGDPAAQAAWRDEVARSASDPFSRRWLLEAAAFAHERAGQFEAAAAAARAVTPEPGTLADLLAERCSRTGPQAALLAERLLASARATEDAREQREIYERLAALDEARGEASSALLWQQAILEGTPGHLPALRALEHARIGAGRDAELEAVAAALAERLGTDPEAEAHALWAARLRAKDSGWESAAPLAELACRGARPSLLALRLASALSRSRGEDAKQLRLDVALAERSARALDASTLRLRAAEAASRLGQQDTARSLLAAAVDQCAEHFVALTTYADVLEAEGEAARAAEAQERIAERSGVAIHQLAAWHHAALLWLDKVGDAARGVRALEQAFERDTTHEDVFARLQAAYIAAGERAKLAELLERRLERVEDPAERVALEVTRGRALYEIGDAAAAKHALAAALEQAPDHIDALRAYADLCAAEGDWSGAEQAWSSLARQLKEPLAQAEIYRRLGALYEADLPNPARAELAYREVLRRLPGDVAASERLVEVYARLGDATKAQEIVEALLGAASTPEETRDRTLLLARVQEEVAGDRKAAEATLEKLRKTHPHDGLVLRALAGYHQRGGAQGPLTVLLDRSANEVRRALGTGRFEASFFEVLATVAELRGHADAASVARATLAMLEGAPVEIAGAGFAAGDPRLDELLAPELFTLPYRALLKKSGDLLDAAFPVDLRGLRAAPLPAEYQAFVAQLREAATAFGLVNLDVYVSPSLGPVCMPACSSPAQIVFGKVLLESEDALARTVLVLRALKILQARLGAFARTAPVDLWPVAAAHLAVFAPGWQPQGADARKFAEARAKIQAAMTQRLDDDVPVLALEVIGSIGNRASQLSTAANQWGNRAALLAVGDPNAALRALALSAGQTAGPPAERAERLKWVTRNPEARDLAVFSASDAYAEARRRIGLG
ncbi:MAG: hypothetical protein IT376_20200 [Polyangiaceae bacterium]|nr:hypothetical protein [Polyangiaceae bacterium]